MGIPYPLHGSWTEAAMFGPWFDNSSGWHPSVGCAASYAQSFQLFRDQYGGGGPVLSRISAKPAGPSVAKRWRQTRTVGRLTGSRLAIWWFDIPSAAIKTIRHRVTTLWGVL